MDNKYIRAPWRLENTEILDAEDFVVADMFYGNAGECHMLGSIIAAAPELYMALSALVKMLSMDDTEEARRVLAKADGQAA